MVDKLDKMFKVLTGIEEYELILMYQKGIITRQEGVDVQSLRSDKISNFEITFSQKLGTLCWKLKNCTKFLNLFRMDVLEVTSKKIVGMELKRGCQYNREWIRAITFDKDFGEILVHSTNGSIYNADKIRVYSNETTLTPLFNFAAMLLVTEVEVSDCQSCMG